MSRNYCCTSNYCRSDILNSTTNCKITIDGSAGTGKSSLAKKIAQELNLVHLDTGALYRCVTLYFMNNFEIKNLDEETLQQNFKNINIEYGVSTIKLNGNDVTTQIRTNDVSQNTSKLSTVKIVREFVTKLQKDIILKNEHGIILDGRDSGTVVMPEADVKFFVETSARIRAIRRLKDQNKLESEENISFLEAEIKQRDDRDKNREVDPLKPASDACIIDNSNDTLDETFDKMIQKINQKTNQKI